MLFLLLLFNAFIVGGELKGFLLCYYVTCTLVYVALKWRDLCGCSWRVFCVYNNIAIKGLLCENCSHCVVVHELPCSLTTHLCVVWWRHVIGANGNLRNVLEI